LVNASTVYNNFIRNRQLTINNRLTSLFEFYSSPTNLFFMKQMNRGSASRLSRSMALLSGLFMVSLQLVTGKASAQVANYTGTGGTSTAVTYYTNESGTTLTKTGFGSASSCGSGGLSGMTMSTSITSYASGNPHVYYKVTPNAGYEISVNGISAICRSSGTGPTKARLAYSLDNGTTWIDDATDHAQLTTGGCGASTNSFSWTGGISVPGVTATNGIIIAVYPYSAGGSGGTFQVNQLNVSGSVNAVSTCSGTPTAGSVSPAIASFCGGGSTNVTLSGASGGSGISYQWESSADGTTWSSISGATDVVYGTGSISATTYYRATTTCSVSGLSATTSSTSVAVNTIPSVDPITGGSIVTTGSTLTLSSTTGGGVWSSSSSSVATIGSATGVVTGVAPGTSTISYAVTSGGCTGYATSVITDMNAGTLALYIGNSGTSTSVLGISGETVGTLAAVGTSTATPCSTGGLSGMTVNSVNVTYNAAGPHVAFQILPTTGNQLNVTGFSAITRESSTGPTQARLAYSLDGGVTWIDDATDHAQSTGGSCGANSNSFSWTSGITVSGITSTTNGIIVAIYAYAPGASTGAFQVNRITISGSITPAGSCTGAAGGTAAAATSAFCGSGNTTINITGGSAGSGISYQWQSSADGTTYTDISGETNASYVAPSLSATTYYQAVTTCAFGGSATSAPATVTINALPAAGTITGVPTYVYIGTATTLSNAVTGGTWSSSNVGVATIGSTDGTVIGLIPGTSNVTYTVADGTCTNNTTAAISVLQPNTIAAYLGESGNSVATTAFAGVSTTTVTAAGFGVNSPCVRGGISGLTNNAVHTFDPANASVFFKVTANSGNYYDVTGFHATLRRSNSGIQKVRMAYSIDNGDSWNDDGIDQAPDNAGCSISTTDFAYSASLPTGVANSGDGVIFALYPYDPISDGGTIQVNSIDVTGTVSACPATAAIDGGDQTICTGSTTTLTDATSGGIWTSSDETVATVGITDGFLTGVTDGIVTITYTTFNVCGSSDAYITVTVNTCGAKSANGVTSTEANDAVTLYPNPATSTLYVNAAQSVNVSILSVDGRIVLEQKNAKSINVSNLASGVYMVKIVDQHNQLVKTARFTKH
jgi:hypothetical protein